MKISLTGGQRTIGLLQAPLSEILRQDLTHGQISAVNDQIRKFGSLKSSVEQTLELTRSITRSYDAAVTTPFNSDFRGTYTSANAEMLTSDYQTVARARTIAKDTPQGRAIMRTLANNVVGADPFKLDMRVGKWTKAPHAQTGEMVRKFVAEEETNAAFENEWRRFGKPKYFTVKRNMSRVEAWRIMEMSCARDGFIMQRHHRDFPYNPYRYAVELLERDRLQSQFYGRARDTNNPIRFSIEFDQQWNYPVAYHVLSMHPGDAFGQSQMAGYTMAGWNKMGGGQQLFRVRIDADEMIVFNNLRDRAEQDVGFTELDATIQSLWRIFQYEKALTYAAIASCMKVFWFKKMFPTGLSLDADQFDAMVKSFQSAQVPGYTQGQPGTDQAQLQQGIQPRKSTEIPGATLDLPFGLELMQTDPKFPIEAAHNFRLDNLRDIAVGAGVRYQDISGDFQNLGFAAALMCSTPAQDNFKARQRNFIENVIEPTFEEWARAAILSGVFDRKYGDTEILMSRLDDYIDAARFKGRRWPFVNPLVQAQCLIIMLEAGLMSPQQVQDELPDGISIEDLHVQIAEAREDEARHGLNFQPVDVTRPTISKGEPGETKPTPQEQVDAQPPPKTRPANPVRGRGRISMETLSLIEQQGDGCSRNGEH